MKKSYLDTVKFLIFLGIGSAILYFVYLNQEAAYQLECQCKGVLPEDCSLVSKVMSDFKSVNVFWLLIVVLAFLISNVSRALRWNMLIKPLGYSARFVNTFFATMIGYMVNLALPRAGEIAKPATVSQYEGVPLDKLMGTIVVDRALDILMLLLLTGLTFLLQFNQLYSFLFGEKIPMECVVPIEAEEPGIFTMKNIFIGALILGFAVLVVAFVLRKRLVKTALFKKVVSLIKGFWEGIKTVAQLDKPVLFIAHTLIIWIMYYLMMYLSFFAFPATANLGLLAGLLAFMFGTFGIVIPSPGGMGTYQLAVMSALIIYNVPNAEAFSFANIVFFTITGCNIVFGFLGYLILPFYNRLSQKNA